MNTNKPKPMTTPLQAVQPLLNQIQSINQKYVENLNAKSPSPSLVDLSMKMFHALAVAEQALASGHLAGNDDALRVIRAARKNFENRS